MANILPEEDDEEVEFSLANPVRRADPRWISVRQVLGTTRVEQLAVLAQQIVERLGKPEAMGKVLSRLHRLWQIRERDIPIIKISHELEDVAEIFARLNQEGTRVKEADVVLALAAAKNPGWVRTDYLPFSRELEDKGWDLDSGVFIRTMTGIGLGRARLKEVPREFWDPNNLQTIWKTAKATIIEVLKRLAEYGITNAQLLPSTNSLVPLFVFFHHWKDKPEFSFPKVLRWFLLANRDGRYSGAAITTLNEDLRTIKERTSFHEVLATLESRLRIPDKVDEADFLKRYDRQGNYFLRLMLYLLLVRRGARDWVDKTPIAYDTSGSSFTAGFQPQWHHIFPSSVLSKEHLGYEQIHRLANMTVLNERSNVNKLAGKPPATYIKRFQIRRDFLQAHLIPEPFASADCDSKSVEQCWNVKQYDEFCHRRAKVLAEEANSFLEQLRNS